MTTVGVVAALPAEAGAFCGRPCRARAVIEFEDAVIACSGMGAGRAAAAAEDLVARGVTGLVSWGVAGGLDAAVRPGDLLLPEEVRTAKGRRWTPDPAWRLRLQGHLGHNLPVSVGAQLMSDEVITSSTEKRRLADTGALAVDMESGGVGEVARSAGLPFLVVRAVCDPAECAPPRSALASVDSDGRFRPWSFAWSLMRWPTDLFRLARLQRYMSAAEGTLREVARLAGSRLQAV